ncbi:MAG TPA: MBL fold metallo-hydrolase [Longimicrobiales bacterium]|nr:MBL fold metallo-hydrolase [Longimicrobiales bacterium]
MLKWSWQRARGRLPADPAPERLPRAEPEIVRPRLDAASTEIRATWIGQATFLVQLPGLNLLTDPVFSDRASPVQWAGPRRFAPPGVPLDELPPIDAVLLSHDHYDHMDRPTIRRLADGSPDATWFTPLGYRRWLGRRGVRRVAELDWWEEASHESESGVVAGIRCLPARHWTRRRLRDTRKRLWSAWRLEAAGRRVYFGGDSGYGPAFAETAAREAPFDVLLLPIGAYEPRWFMAAAHMNPEEAAQAYADLGGRGACIGMHWGTFPLTDEDPLEPPARMRTAWSALGLPASDLYLPPHGKTLRL